MYIPIWLIILAIIVLFLINRGKEKQKEFSPIRISIEPKWDNLLKDYNIITDDAWKEKIPQDKEYNVLKSGVTFTILTPDLIYDDNQHNFQSRVDIRRQIDEIGSSQAQRVDFYVKGGIEGYEIGLTTFESRRKSYMPGDGMECIKVATIPYSELLFPLYKQQSKKKQAEIEQNLKNFGWTRQAPDIELSFIAPEVILEHKYFFADYTYV